MSVQVLDRKYMEYAKGSDETKRNKTKRNEAAASLQTAAPADSVGKVRNVPCVLVYTVGGVGGGIGDRQ